MGTRCTAAQCHTLLLLHQRGTLPIGDIADALDLDKSTVSRSVQPLLARNLVEVDPHPEDGRSKPLRLTAEGKKLVGSINDTADQMVGRALDTLPPEDQATVLRGMELYAQALARGEQLAEVSIRRIQPSDDPGMADIIRTVMTEFGAVGAGFSIEDPEVDGMTAAYSDPRAAYFVALRGDELLGGAGIAQLEGAEPHVCELKKMYVLPAGRGLGIGRRLMDLCLDAARDAGYTLCYLETLSHMTQARHLYEKHGFQRIDHALGNTGHHGCNSWYTLPLE